MVARLRVIDRTRPGSEATLNYLLLDKKRGFDTTFVLNQLLQEPAG